VNVIQGQLNAKGMRFGVIASRFNEFITNKLLGGAMDCFERHGGETKDADVVWVPGSFEIPLIAQRMAASKKYDAVICLAAVIRGGTPHFDYVASEVTKGVAQVGLHSGVPTIFGVLTTNNIEEAIERAGTKQGNKGWDAALSAIEMADLMKQMDK